MHVDADRLRLSPSDLSSFLGCRHRTGLDLAVLASVLAKPIQDDARVQALRDRGAAHERAYVERLRSEGRDLVVIATEGETAARVVGYGSMLLEGMVAVVSLSCVMMLAANDEHAFRDCGRRHNDFPQRIA